MSSRWELDDGIKSIKSAWQREHTARANLEKMLENAESENVKLRELVRDMHAVISDRNSWWDCMCKDTRRFADRMRELGVVE